MIKKILSYFNSESNKEKLNQKLVYSSAYVFSAFLDANLFMGLALDNIFKYFLGGFGIVWTSLKTTILKKYLHEKDLTGKGNKFLLVAYLLFAGVSYFAAQGLIQENILRQNQVNNVVNSNSDIYKDQIINIGQEISSLKAQVNLKMNDEKIKQDIYSKNKSFKDWEEIAYRKSIEQISNQIDQLNNEISKKYNEITVLQQKESAEKVNTKVIASNIYDILADSIPFNKGHGDRLNKGDFISGSNVEFIIGSLIGIAIEISLWVTVSIKKKVKFSNKENRNNLILYVNTLFAVKGARLTPDKIISEKTGINSVECRRYRNLLANHLHDDKPLITLARGGSVANFSKENIIKILEEDFELE